MYFERRSDDGGLRGIELPQTVEIMFARILEIGGEKFHVVAPLALLVWSDTARMPMR
jgi:hypothetical protein